MAKKEEIPRPTRARLDEWAKREPKRLKAQRQAKDLKALQKKIEDEALAWAQANADETRVVMCHGYRLELDEKRESVAWKDEFLRVVGPKGHEEAEKIIAAQETWDEIEIHPPADK